MAGLARRSLATITTFVLLAAVGFTLGALAGILWEQPRLILTYLTGGTTEIAWRGDGQAALPDVAAAPDAAESPAIEPLAIAPAPAAPPATPERSAVPGPEAPEAEPQSEEPPPAPAAPVVVARSKAAPGATAVRSAPAPAPAPAPVARPAPPRPPPAAARASAKPEGRFAVQVGAFGTSESAERLAERLEEKGYSAYVTPGTGSANARWRVRVGPLADKSGAESVAARLKKNEKLPTWILEEAGN